VFVESEENLELEQNADDCRRAVAMTSERARRRRRAHDKQADDKKLHGAAKTGFTIRHAFPPPPIEGGLRRGGERRRAPTAESPRRVRQRHQDIRPADR
jgi:hypothetical protein